MTYNKHTKDERQFIKRVNRVVKINRKINPNRMPAHMGIIMDGNGRWATRRGLPRAVGHRAGYRSLILASKRCAELGIGVLSVFAFSTENWKRPKEELDAMFKIVRDNILRDVDEFVSSGIKIITSGDVTRFPEDLQENLRIVKEKTAHCDRMILNFCINYGGRDDIINAVNTAIADGTTKLTEDDITNNLYTRDLPPLDFLIRTSGEMRVSNFLLWQMAYAEFYFEAKHWPSVDEKMIDNWVIEFQRRNRRFGNVK